MTALALPAPARPWQPRALLWPALAVATVLLALYGAALLPDWMLAYPRRWQVPAAAAISDAMDWLVNTASFGLFTFRELTRGIAWLLRWPLDLAIALFSTGLLRGEGTAAVQLLPPLSWVAVTAGAVLLGLRLGGWRLALLVGACFLYLALFGQWQSAMVTLASIVIAVPFGAAGGLLLGIAGHRSAAVERVLRPALDLMQTVPIFAYLVPILFLFGFGPVAAMIATIIYAMPPMVRVTLLALRGVPAEIVDFGRMAGCTRRQLTWRVLVPSARPALMLGVNQVIMLSLNMVIIASMIGAGGLGFDVLSNLRRLDIGAGLEAGLAIVVLAVALDRLSQGLAHPAAARPGFGWRHILALAVAMTVLTGLAGLVLPALQAYPASLQVTTAPLWGGLVQWINVHFFDTLEAAKNLVLLNVLVPFKRLLLAVPWPWAIGLLALAGWRLGGPLLSLEVAVLAGFIAVTGQWENAVVTVYLTAIAVVIAALIGIPIGIAAALSPRLWRIVQGAVDVLQTLPSFVYLIPVVMLFRVGDFAALIAVVAYAVAPAIRYTAFGVREVDGRLIEAGIATGCTRRQLLWRIRLPLALPQILLGINQTIMLALSMLVITALVGTRDLGQEVYVALTRADPGRGLVAGLAVAAIAIIADRLFAAATRRTQLRLGLLG